MRGYPLHQALQNDLPDMKLKQGAGQEKAA
jgi:hypothetical protein